MKLLRYSFTLHSRSPARSHYERIRGAASSVVRSFSSFAISFFILVRRILLYYYIIIILLLYSRQALARVHAAAWAATLLCFGVGYACAAVRAIPQPAVIAATFAAAVAAAPPPPPLSCPSANSPLRAWTSATPPRRHRPRASLGAAVAQGKSRSDPRGLQSQLRGGEQEERRAGRGAAAGPLEQPLLSWREGAAAEQDNRPAAVDVQG